MTLEDIISEYILGNLTIDELKEALDDWLYNEICKKVQLFKNSIVSIAMTICITIAAIYFGRTSILWFYIIPLIVMENDN